MVGPSNHLQPDPGAAMTDLRQMSRDYARVEAAIASSGHVFSLQHRALILGSTQAVIQAVIAGLGMGFVSARAAAQAVQDGRLAGLGLEGVDLRRSLYLAYLPQRASDPLLVHFLAFVRSFAARQAHALPSAEGGPQRSEV